MTYEYKSGMGATMSALDFIKSASSNTAPTGVSKGGAVSTLGPMTSDSGGGSSASPFMLIKPLVSATWIPAGRVPVPPADRAWFKKWIMIVYRSAYNTQRAVDPGFTYAYPNLLARFIDARAQVIRLIRSGVVDVTIGAGGVVIRDAGRTGDRTNALRRRAAVLAYWKKCDKDGASAWMAAPSSLGLGYKLPQKVAAHLKGVGTLTSFPCPMHGSPIYTNVFQVTTSAKKTSSRKLLENYTQSQIDTAKDQARTSKAGETSVREDLTASQQETADAVAAEAAAQALLDDANQELQARTADVNSLTGTVGTLQASLEIIQAQLLAANNQPAGSVDGDVLSQMVAQVTQLTQQLQETQDQLEEAREVESAAEDAIDVIGDVAGGGFLSRNKWYLAAGGFAVAGAGLWYYFMKYKPSKEAEALVANTSIKVKKIKRLKEGEKPEDTEKIKDVCKRSIGSIKHTEGTNRWDARSIMGVHETYSANSRKHAVEWLNEIATQANWRF